MGVITYFLLCGYRPFNRDTPEEEARNLTRRLQVWAARVLGKRLGDCA